MWRVLLLILAAWNFVWAALGFWILGPAGAPGWTTDFLAGSPFTNYWGPALILLAVVGGSQLIAFILMLRRRASAPFWAAVAGFGLVIWIVVEQVLFRVPDTSGEWILLPILQLVFAGTGLAQLGCVLGLLGIFEPEHRRAVMGTAPRPRRS